MRSRPHARGQPAAGVFHSSAIIALLQPPSTAPLYYRVAASLLTQADAIQVLGDDTLGQAEPVLGGTS